MKKKTDLSELILESKNKNTGNHDFFTDNQGSIIQIKKVQDTEQYMAFSFQI